MTRIGGVMQASMGAHTRTQVSRIAVQTGDLELAHELLSENYAAHRPHYRGSRERFHFSLNSTSVGSIASDALTHSMGTVAAIEPLRYLTAACVVRGGVAIQRGHDETHTGPDDVFLYPYGTNFEVRWDTMDQRLIRLDFDKVTRFAAATTGTDAPLRFLSVHPITPEMGQYWRTVTDFVHRELADRGSTITDPLVLARIEDTLAAAALSVFPNTSLTARASPTLIGRVGPATLRRATAYIESHAGDAITLTDIVAHAGASGRALQRSFAAHHHTTPTGYLRRVRLEHAHRELQAGDPTRDSVGQIARRWGFTTRGGFADAYRRVYGVDPNHTLHR